MHITVKMFPAKNGDCFLVSLGSKNKKHILIDCGYVDTYRKFLKKELIKIANNNEAIDLMVITHIDQDHILGALSLIKENNEAPFIEIKEIWHNSYRHLQFGKDKVDKITKKEMEILSNEVVLGSSFLQQKMDKSEIREEDISAKQGSMLAALILEGGYSWNESFNGNAVNCENISPIIKDQYTLTLLSPNTNKLKRLSTTWLRELRKQKINFSLSDEQIFDDAYEFFLIRQDEYEVVESDISSKVNNYNEKSIEDIVLQNSIDEVDNSETNGSSISFVIEYCGKRLLFLADAHSDIISENISKLEEKYFDLVKLSHHGSKKNISKKLIENLNSELFLISTNGDKHGHPDFESLAKILYYQRHKSKTLVFNYETDTSKILNLSNWKEKYNYRVRVSDGTEATIVKL
ncbi:MBL fold metallo-hydrolase [Planococcus sp. CP5-4]|uniref:MBL fold metallo-hydrolase n=1 Tax=unclassified Planococcus (in: firmicutes) TaxID=2662419 RepID=UPI001C224C15|nr:MULTISPECIES: MBL fold metallo-hydrolase [unclassified Planococcus (in: firmicutes)]MBU9672659.1 MBL fold metallo-hydrolase [Planococcus sp. CP5-4_YE]MBV0910719.1 MBL fold metallo-hydrolase [Planococcus sp. CP5-4_UN]MBW6065480.1 MBL fold metallo-hydrolase [Planococcus sp. CP5-4]